MYHQGLTALCTHMSSGPLVDSLDQLISSLLLPVPPHFLDGLVGSVDELSPSGLSCDVCSALVWLFDDA